MPLLFITVKNDYPHYKVLGTRRDKIYEDISHESL